MSSSSEQRSLSVFQCHLGLKVVAVVVVVGVRVVLVPGVLARVVRAGRKAAQDPTTPPARPAPAPRKMHPVATPALLMRPIQVMVGRLQAR